MYRVYFLNNFFKKLKSMHLSVSLQTVHFYAFTDINIAIYRSINAFRKCLLSFSLSFYFSLSLYIYIYIYLSIYLLFSYYCPPFRSLPLSVSWLQIQTPANQNSLICFPIGFTFTQQINIKKKLLLNFIVIYWIYLVLTSSFVFYTLKHIDLPLKNPFSNIC